jgi:DNA-binding CsgD family transcriptional regulator
MRQTIDLEKTRTHLALALDVLHNDRWILGGVRDGRMRVIADSTLPEEPVQPLYLELSQMARRCLYERHPLAVTSIVEPRSEEGDWEIDWPALIYAPVGIPKTRPVGILIVGSRTEHWYTQDEIDYVSALGVTLTTAVSCLTGPLGRLEPPERKVALLMAEGMSDDEIARATGSTAGAVAKVSDAVLRKLSVRSRREVRELVPLNPGLAPAPRPTLL